MVITEMQRSERIKNFIEKLQKHPIAFLALPGLVIFFALIAIFKTPPAVEERDHEHIEGIVYEPEILYFDNAYVTDSDRKGVHIFYEGEELFFPYEKYCERENDLKKCLADLVVTDGEITAVHGKRERINGRLLKADGDFIELEEHGQIPMEEDYKCYLLTGKEPVSCGREMLGYGYDLTDFIIENGRIAGALRLREEPMERIRVLIKASDYDGLLHEEADLTCDTDFDLIFASEEGRTTEHYEAGEVLHFTTQSAYLNYGSARIVPAEDGSVILNSVNRKLGTPSCKGCIELKKAEGKLAMINELPLEKYLYSVIPSEMPASYPAQALKVQAVCARTYAYGHMQKASYPRFGAHLDDSTSYQVYNNNSEDARTNAAVDDTAGILLMTPEGKVAETYYYSTSAGIGTRADIWKSPDEIPTYLKSKRLSRSAVKEKGKGDPEKDGFALMEEENFARFITSVDKDDYESDDGWYRWSYEVKELSASTLYDKLVKNYEKNTQYVLTLTDDGYKEKPIQAFSSVKNISVTARCMGGSADELIIETDKATYKVITEGNIRSVLCEGNVKVKRQDGSNVSTPKLLPSAYFIIETFENGDRVTGYRLTGGGFGHGIGMSQNGARYMAAEGLSAEQILTFFYDGCKLVNYTEQRK